LKLNYGIPFPVDINSFFPRFENAMVTCLGDLHPSAHLCKDAFFTGMCGFSPNTRKWESLIETNPQLKSILDNYEEINPLPIVNSFLPIDYKKRDKNLIYAALGTVYSFNVAAIQMILESFEILGDDIGHFDVIFPMGGAFSKINQKIKDGLLKVPKNVLILERAPQINVLKRASLFITHCGMNSTSESIHYGVPMICLPQGDLTDQPVVANRIADQLGCGIRLNWRLSTPTDIATAIKVIINDECYLERTLRMSVLSNRYNGGVRGANHIIKMINENRKKNE
jgi:UDP:flavonoid glycosyltransferase YjiC (YdhE family)